MVKLLDKLLLSLELYYILYLGEASENLRTLPGTPVSTVTRLVVAPPIFDKKGGGGSLNVETMRINVFLSTN